MRRPLSSLLAMIGVLIACDLTPAVATAQAGGGVSFVPDTSEGARGRDELYRLADCLRDRVPGLVGDLLAYNVAPGARMAAMLYSDQAKRCVSAGGAMNADVLMGALFRSAYLAQGDVKPLAQSDLDRQALSFRDREGVNDPVDYMLFADCVASRNPADSQRLLVARPGRSDEEAILQVLQAEGSVCAAPLDDPSVKATPFVMAMAQVSYRRSRNESFDPSAAPSGAGQSEPAVECESARPDVCVVRPASAPE